MGLTGWYVSQTQEQTDGQELTVVTSFYPMYIAAENVIGDADGVRLENLSEPQTGCLHDFQLTPEDMKLLSTADVFIINGGGIESFMKEVAEAYPNLKIIEACENISLLSGEEDDTTGTDDCRWIIWSRSGKKQCLSEWGKGISGKTGRTEKTSGEIKTGNFRSVGDSVS